MSRPTARDEAITRLSTIVDLPTPYARTSQAEWIIDAIIAAVRAERDAEVSA